MVHRLAPGTHAPQAKVAPIRSSGSPVDIDLAQRLIALYEELRSNPDCLF